MKGSPAGVNDNKFGRVEGVPEGEPCFVLRAKDQATVSTLEDYKKWCLMLGSPRSHVDAIDEQIHRIRVWQIANPTLMKVPD